MSHASVLETRQLSARYGDFQALFGVDFQISPGEVVALIGANGAGKSTFLRSIMGLLPVARDMIVLDGKAIGGSPPHIMVKNGLAMVPEGRRLFRGMSVEDNLLVALDQARNTESANSAGAAWSLERVFQLFPVLAERRRANVESLSGGQQQMVAIGRALLNQPRLLLCDEISLGLAPRVIGEIYASLPTIAASGMALVLVEQDVSLAQKASSRLYCMLEGRVTLSGNSQDISRAEIAHAYFGAGHEVA